MFSRQNLVILALIMNFWLEKKIFFNLSTVLDINLTENWWGTNIFGFFELIELAIISNVIRWWQMSNLRPVANGNGWDRITNNEHLFAKNHPNNRFFRRKIHPRG